MIAWVAFGVFALIHGALFTKALSDDKYGYRWLLVDLAFVLVAVILGGVIEAIA